MTLADFRNAALILRALDRDTLITEGVIPGGSLALYKQFQDDPVRWLLHAEDAVAARLWSVVDRNLPRKERLG